MGGKSSGDGPDGCAEGRLPSPQRAGNRRRRQSVGGTCGVLETEGFGLCGRSVEPASVGNTYPSTCHGGRFSSVVTDGQSDRASNPGGTATPSGKGQVLP